MPTWKKVIVSGSIAELQTVSASNPGVGFYGTASWAVSASWAPGAGTPIFSISGSSASDTSSFTANADTLYLTGSANQINVSVVGGTSITTASFTLPQDIGTTSNVTFGDVAVNGGDLTTTQTTFNLLAGATDTLNVGAATTTSSFAGQVTIGGDLTVNGTTTTINTENLLVEDQFILLASGSTVATDAGLNIDRGGDLDGNIAFGYDAGVDRWGFENQLTDITNVLDTTNTTGTIPSSSFVSYLFTEAAHGASGRPTGGEFLASGSMYIDNAGDVWFYA